jgi:acetolactate synthase regulatory subunit
MRITKNTQTMMRITKVCETCGSQAVQIDACAEWDFDSQSWELQSTYDHSRCYDCDADTNIIDQEVKETSA